MSVTVTSLPEASPVSSRVATDTEGATSWHPKFSLATVRVMLAVEEVSLAPLTATLCDGALTVAVHDVVPGLQPVTTVVLE